MHGRLRGTRLLEKYVDIMLIVFIIFINVSALIADNGFAGVCPVLCSGHGAYAGGVCHCSEGWKGAECDVPAHDCEPADCSGRGQCIAGHCHCKAGWKGPKCDEGK